MFYRALERAQHKHLSQCLHFDFSVHQSSSKIEYQPGSIFVLPIEYSNRPRMSAAGRGESARAV